MAKDKTPLLLKIVRWAYPKVEKIWPAVAYRYFVSLFFTPLNYPVPTEEKEAALRAEKFFIEVDNKKVQGYSWGSGIKIVMVVHGWAGRATQFRNFILPFLNAGYRVVGFDAPAHGNSQGKTTNIFEFEVVLRKIYERVGEPDAIIAHSFGGGAVLFSAMHGLPVRKLINIASPTIGDEIIKTYLTAIHGSPETGKFFKDYILKEHGKPFDNFTASYFVQNLPNPIALLLVHDEDDHEVSIQQAIMLQKIYPRAKLYKTKGLGHTRILRDSTVIQMCLTFIQQGDL